MNSMIQSAMIALLLVLFSPEAFSSCYTKHKCGHYDQWGAKACKIWQCVPSCSGGNHEDLRKGKCYKNKNCFQKHHCGGHGQKACLITQCTHACKHGLKQFGLGLGDSKCGSNCFDTHKCGKKGQKPCTINKCIPSCDKHLYEDVAKGKCLKPKKGHSVWTSTLASIGEAIRKPGKGCKATLDKLPHMKPGKTLESIDAFSGACVAESSIGFLCGTFKYAGDIFTAMATEGENLKHFSEAVEHAYNSSHCHKLAPTDRSMCGLLYGLSGETTRSYTCVKKLYEKLSKEKGSKKAQFDSKSCQMIGEFAMSVLLDKLAINALGGADQTKRRLIKIAQLFRTALAIQTLAGDQLEKEVNSIPECRN